MAPFMSVLSGGATVLLLACTRPTISSPDLRMATCLGPPDASHFAVYLHGVDQPSVSAQELGNRKSLGAIAKALSIRIALPRASMPCPNEPSSVCWAWSFNEREVDATVEAMTRSAAACFGTGRPFGLIGFSNGGYLITKLLRLQPHAEVQVRMSTARRAPGKVRFGLSADASHSSAISPRARVAVRTWRAGRQARALRPRRHPRRDSQGPRRPYREGSLRRYRGCRILHRECAPQHPRRLVTLRHCCHSHPDAPRRTLTRSPSKPKVVRSNRSGRTGKQGRFSPPPPSEHHLEGSEHHREHHRPVEPRCCSSSGRAPCRCLHAARPGPRWSSAPSWRS
jgi:hypothetical protein